MDGRTGKPGGDADYRRRIVLLALAEAAFVLFVLLPGLIYLYVLDNGLSERDLMLYVVALIALQVAVSGLLLWTFRIHPEPQSDTRDAR